MQIYIIYIIYANACGDILAWLCCGHLHVCMQILILSFINGEVGLCGFTQFFTYQKKKSLGSILAMVSARG